MNSVAPSSASRNSPTNAPRDSRHVGGGEMKIHSSVSDTGDSEEKHPLTYDGPAVEIGFNAQYLLDFFRAVGTDEVRFLFKDAHSAGELRAGGEGADQYRYVIMPMRI